MKNRHFLLALAVALAGTFFLMPELAPPNSERTAAVLRAPATVPSVLPAASDETPVQDPALSEAFSRARREVRALTGAESLITANDGALYFAFHPGQNLTARFQADGIQIGQATGGQTLQITRREGGSARVSAAGSRATYQRADGSTEWFDNADAGFEHGMTLASRPANAGEALRIGFCTAGLRAAEDPQHPGDLIFTDHAGQPVLGYRDLRAWDATGRDLPGALAVNDGGFEWVIDDRAATYPVTIDPLVVNLDGTLESATSGATGQFASGQVAIDGDRAAVGAQSETTPSASGAGTVYLFRRVAGNWSLEQRLESFDPQVNEGFGSKLALDGDWLAVLARYDSNPFPGGSVQLFQNTGSSWFFGGRLQSGTNLIGSDSMALKGSTLVVGVSGKMNFSAVSSGGILVASRDFGGWNPFVETYASDGLAGDSFGRSVATDGIRIAVGAPGRDSGGKSGSGAVYVFQGSSFFWSQEATLLAADGQPNDSLGASVAIDNGRVVAGAPDQKRGTLWDGAAYVFATTGGNWTQEAKLFAPVATGAHVALGAAVAISGQRLAVSTQYSKAFGGQVLVYERIAKTWIRRSSLATDFTPDYRFSSLSMDESRLLAGFPIYTGNGAALVYELGNSSPAQEISVFTGPDTALQETQSGTPVNFGEAYLNEFQTWPVTVYNDGTAMLEVSGATLLAGASAGLSADPVGPLPGSQFIAPGETARILLRTQFPDAGTKSGTLRLASNDVSEPNFDVPVTFQAVPRPAPLGLTIRRENGWAVLRYPHLQFFNYSVQRSTSLTGWITIGSMQTEFDPATSSQIKVFRDFSPPLGKAFYKVTMD